MTLRTLRILLVVDVISLLLVAALHAGILTGGPFQNAAMYEAAVAVILALALALTFAGSVAVARWAAVVAQVLALLGVGTGVYMASRGMAPNTTLDDAYHAFFIVTLLAGLVLALRLEDERQPAVS